MLNAINQYLEVTLKIRELEIEKAGLAASILKSMNDLGYDSVSVSGYKISVCSRKKFNYPDEVLEIESALKQAKKTYESLPDSDYDSIIYLSAKTIKS